MDFIPVLFLSCIMTESPLIELDLMTCHVRHWSRADVVTWWIPQGNHSTIPIQLHHHDTDHRPQIQTTTERLRDRLSAGPWTVDRGQWEIITPRSMDNPPRIVTITTTVTVVTNHHHLLSRTSPIRSQFTLIVEFRPLLSTLVLLFVTTHFNLVFIKKNKSNRSFFNTRWLVFQLKKNNIPPLERNHLRFWNQCCYQSYILAAFKMYPIDVLHHIYHFPHRDLPSSQDETSCIAIAKIFKDFCSSFSVSIC